MELTPEGGLSRFAEINRATSKWRVHPLFEGRAIVEEYAVELSRFRKQDVLRNLLHNFSGTDPLDQMPIREHAKAMRDADRVISIMVWEAEFEAAQEERTVHQNRR